jgi:hypothetical protein
LENLVLDVKDVRDVEVTSEFLILRVPGEGEGEKVMGLWIHGDRDDTREKNAGTIMQCWEKVTGVGVE